CGEGFTDIGVEYQSLPSICSFCKAFGHATEKCKAKKLEEESEGWIKAGKGKGKAPEVQSGGEFSKLPSTSCCQQVEGTTLQIAVAEEKETSLEEEPA
ncbi:hypothetical protein U1Q18_009940, partial [Sarracenia purpurea var. burkii]